MPGLLPRMQDAALITGFRPFTGHDEPPVRTVAFLQDPRAPADQDR